MITDKDRKIIILNTIQYSRWPVTARELTKDVGWPAQEGSPRVRELITELITEGHPIGANSHGFFLIKTDEQFMEYIIQLNSRLSGISSRIQAVTNAYIK